MKNKTVSRILRVVAALSLAYYLALLLYKPHFEASFRQLMLLLRNFSNVWLLLALLCFWAAHHIALRGKENRYVFMQDFPRAARVAVVAIVACGVCICAVALSFILRPVIDKGGGQDCEYVIVLGGRVGLDGTLPRGVQLKLAAAAEYATAHPDVRIIVTGGQLPFHRYSEAQVMAKELEGLGVAGERIFAEDQAQDTIQNLRNSASIIAREEGISLQQALTLPVTIITSRFHLRRAQILAGRLGYQNVRGIPTKIQPLNVLTSYAREICAYIKLALRIILTGQPASLVSAFDTSANANIWNAPRNILRGTTNLTAATG